MAVHYIIQGLFVLVGLLALLAAQNTRFIVANAGRSRARLFYAAIGALMIGTGVFFFLSVRGII